MKSDEGSDPWMEDRSAFIHGKHCDRDVVLHRKKGSSDCLGLQYLDVWQHDLYDPQEQRAKSDSQIISEYGYNIREYSYKEAVNSGRYYGQSRSCVRRLRRKKARALAQARLAASRRTQDWDTDSLGPVQKQVFYVELPKVVSGNPTITYTAPLSMVPAQLVINFVKPENVSPSSFEVPLPPESGSYEVYDEQTGTGPARLEWHLPTELMPLRLPRRRSAASTTHPPKRSDDSETEEEWY